MRKIYFLFLVSFLVLATTSITAKDITNAERAAKEACYKTLLSGIDSENQGVQDGCSFMLGEVSCDKGVIPLLRILHNDKREEARILAALSLYKIGDARGIFAIKQAIRFDESDRVRRICNGFYLYYMNNKESSSGIDVALDEK